MKTYSIIITIIAVLLIIVGGYFYFQVDKVAQREKSCQKEKADTEQQLNVVNLQVTNAYNLARTLNAILNSFMTAGDLKVLTIGSKEAINVEQTIDNITVSMDRMRVDNQWQEFKSSLKLNPLFGALRALGDDIEKKLAPPNGALAPQ